MDAEATRLLAAGLCMGIGAVGPALGEGMVAAKTMETIGRNPEIGDKLLSPWRFVNLQVFIHL